MDTVTKIGIDAAKTASKRIVQKTAEATGDLIGNKIADKITSLGKKKMKDRKFILHQKKDSKLLTTYVLTPHENGIPKKYKPTRYNI